MDKKWFCWTFSSGANQVGKINKPLPVASNENA